MYCAQYIGEALAMRRVEAEHTARVLNAAPWPAGVTVKADVCGEGGQYVTVLMSVPGLTPVRWKLRRPVGKFGMDELRAECERMLRDGPALPFYPSDPDLVCPQPPWLAETLKRIGRLTKASPVAKGVAVKAARSIEADALPVPVVLDWRHVSVVLRWENLGRTLEVSGDLNGNLSLGLEVPGCPLLIESWPTLNVPRADACVAYDRARVNVYALFEKDVTGTGGILW